MLEWQNQGLVFNQIYYPLIEVIPFKSLLQNATILKSLMQSHTAAVIASGPLQSTDFRRS